MNSEQQNNTEEAYYDPVFYGRQAPEHAIEFQYKFLETDWGSEEVSGKLKETMTDKKEKEELDMIDWWSKLSFFTPDFKKGNLNVKDGQFGMVREDSRLAKDCIFNGFKKAGASILGDVATELALSPSINMALIKVLQTQSIQSRNVQVSEPPKRSLFGLGGKKKNEGLI
jgi:hypothetical protein